jgi:hypothetical protein
LYPFDAFLADAGAVLGKWLSKQYPKLSKEGRIKVEAIAEPGARYSPYLSLFLFLFSLSLFVSYLQPCHTKLIRL